MIKYDSQLDDEIRKTVRNFNAKVRYNKTKTRGRGMLPQRLSIRALKDKYSDKSRKELLKQLKLYQSFGNRAALEKAGDNSRLSKWELDYFKANLQKTKDFYDNEIEDLKQIIGDKPEYFLKQHQRLLTLQGQRKELDKDINLLTEDQIKGMRHYFNYAERSDIIKEKAFRLYLNQLERAMDNLGYSKLDKERLFNKFNQLSENEFTEMMRREDIIDRVFELIDSPKTRGEYELMADEQDARNTIDAIINDSDDLIAKYKTAK